VRVPGGGWSSVRILLADDEAPIRFLVALHLRKRGWVVDEAATGTEALEAATTEDYHALVLDLRLPGMTGVEVARELGGQAPVFLFSALIDDQVRREAAEVGCRVVDKGDLDALLAGLERLAPQAPE
jgi:DNA-binding response OmpR family regulator